MKRSSRRKKNFIVLKQTNDVNKIINFCMNSCWSKTGIFVELMRKVSMKWKNWSDFRVLHSTQLQEEDWSKIKILSLNSQARFRNYKMKLIAWMIREIFIMLNQYAVHIPTLPVNLCLSHLIQFLVECWPFLLECRAAKMGRQAFGTHMVYRETFLQIQPRLLQHLIRRKWIHGVLIYQNTHHHMWWVKARHQLRIRDASQDRHPEIHSSPVSEDFQRVMEQTNNVCRFQILFLTNSPRQQRSLGGRRFNTEVCTCSQFPTEAMLWIKEVEMVESVDDIKTSLSVRGIRTPDFEVLDTKIASALNRIIQNTRFKKKVSLEEQKAQKGDRFLRGRQIAYLIYEYFFFTGADDSVENYADLFTIALRNDDFQEFDSKWDGFFFYRWQKFHLTTSWKDCTN